VTEEEEVEDDSEEQQLEFKKVLYPELEKYLTSWYAEGAAYNVHTSGEELFIIITGKFMETKNFL